MADVAFVPIRGNANEIANTPRQDGQFLYTTDEGRGNKVYADVLRGDGTVDRVGIMGNYVSKDGDTIEGNLTVEGNVTLEQNLYFTSEVGAPIALKEIFKAVYPVGSIYMSTSSTNPASLFGGSWTPWGSGRVPVGINTNDSDFNTVEKQGGEKSHTLTIAEMPKHNHSYSRAGKYNSTNDCYITGPEVTISSVGYEGWVAGGVFWHEHSLEYETKTTEPKGNSTAHNNLQPYITCYMWKRTQ